MRTRRRLGALSLSVLLAAGLTGCMKVDMDLHLQSDDTVDGTMVMAVSAELAEMVGQDAETLADEMSADIGGNMTTGEVSTEPYDDGEFVGTTMTFEGESLASFTDAEDDSLTITREGDEFVVAGVLDLSGGGEELPAGMAESMDVKVAITFPGEVTEHDGELSGTTVTWVPSGAEVLEINARGSAVEGGMGGLPRTILLVAGLGLLVLLLAGLALFLVLRSRRGAASTQGDAATAYPTPTAYPAEAAAAYPPATAYPAPQPPVEPQAPPAPPAPAAAQPPVEPPPPVAAEPPVEPPPADPAPPQHQP